MMRTFLSLALLMLALSAATGCSQSKPEDTTDPQVLEDEARRMLEQKQRHGGG